MRISADYMQMFLPKHAKIFIILRRGLQFHIIDDSRIIKIRVLVFEWLKYCL